MGLCVGDPGTASGTQCTWAVSVFKALVEMGPLRGGGEVMQRGHRDRWRADTGSA